MNNKILFVTQSTIGGTLEYFKLLIPRLRSAGFDITVVCPSYGPMKNELEQLQIETHCLEMKRELDPWHDMVSILGLYKFIKQGGYSILHFHSSKAGALGRIANLCLKIPSVYTPHGWAFDMDTGRIKKVLYIGIERLLGIFTDCVIAISPHERNSALQAGVIKTGKIKTITNGIDWQHLSSGDYDKRQLKEMLQINEQAVVVGMVGRLAQQKDPLTFVRAAGKVIEAAHSDFHFILVGDGELRQEVESEIRRLDLENHFTITGWVNDIRPYINIFDIGVLTSRWEGFGLVLAEFMAAGIPAAASDVDGIRDVIIPGHTGILVEKENIKGFADSILLLAADENLRQYYVENGLKRVKRKFDIERVSKRHIQIYNHLLNITNKCWGQS